MTGARPTGDVNYPVCSVVLPTLNEEPYLSKTLDSLAAQNVEHELIVVDSGSSDLTTAIAERYNARIIDAPRGKLTARHLGISLSRGDVIVAVDADTYYPEGWLARTLKPFQDNKVVGVTGPRLYDMVGQFAMKAFYSVFWRLFGSNSAFRKDVYEMAGGFNVWIDQQDSRRMVDEEEVLFRDRLARYGKVVYQPDNPVITSTRRYSRTRYNPEYSQERFAGSRF